MIDRLTADGWLRRCGTLGLACLLAVPGCGLLKRDKDEPEEETRAAATVAAAEPKRSTPEADVPAGSVSSGTAADQGWSAGSKVQVSWKGKWYPAMILAVGTNGTYKVRYDGWGAEWDEWVTPARMRDSSGTPTAAPAAAAHEVGEKVQVSWKGKWYPATILAVGNNGTYKVHYDGWGAEWDEWVTPARMR